MDAARRRALIFEVSAVLAWVLLPRIASSISSAPRSTPSTDPFGFSRLDSAARGVGILCLLAYIIWNSGDDWSKFGICRPKRPDVAIAVASAAGFFLVLAVPPHLSSTNSLGSWRFPDLQNSRAIFNELYLAISVIVSAVAFQGLIAARLIELFGRSFVAAVVPAMCLATWLGTTSGATGFVFGALEGIFFSLVFLLRRSLWPIILGRVMLYAVVQCYV